MLGLRAIEFATLVTRVRCGRITFWPLPTMQICGKCDDPEVIPLQPRKKFIDFIREHASLEHTMRPIVHADRDRSEAQVVIKENVVGAMVETKIGLLAREKVGLGCCHVLYERKREQR